MIVTLLKLIFLLSIFSCSAENSNEDNIVQSQDYVLIEFAAKLEQAEKAHSTNP